MFMRLSVLRGSTATIVVVLSCRAVVPAYFSHGWSCNARPVNANQCVVHGPAKSPDETGTFTIVV